MSDRPISHRTLPVTAPESFWRALGWQTYSNEDHAGNHSSHHRIDEQLAVAVATTGHRDERALAAAVAECQRQHEEWTRVTALAREADAIASLASSLRSEADSTVLARIMARLSDSTRWALRKQLAGTGLLPG